MSLVNKKESLKKMGFSPKTLSLMTESEISKLFKNFIYESKKETKEAITVKDPKKALEIQKMDPNAKIEVTEKKTTKKKNPWAICTSVMGAEFGSTERSDWSKKQMGKYEKCVMGVKKSIKEGKNPEEVLLENKFRIIIEKNLKPTITKGDLLNMINEQPVETPVKPTTKPRVKPGSPLPNPGSLPKPKALEQLPNFMKFSEYKKWEK